MMTVADIRKAIAGLNDNDPVVVVIRTSNIDGADGGPNVPAVVQVVGVNGLAERLEIDINAPPPAP
jgi:hypothetical protein